VESKQEEIWHLLEANREQIEKKELVVYLIDECHLLWGDVCGYGWGATKERLEVPMSNERDRATYYGALNYQTKQLVLQEYDAGNAKNTVSFLEKLRQLNPDSRLLVIWDGASYHRYKEMKTYLQEVNYGLEETKREINCVLFAPNAPEQNPVENIWLQGKNYLRKFWYKLTSFKLVKWFFTFLLANEFFKFPKVNKYGYFSNQADKMRDCL